MIKSNYYIQYLVFSARIIWNRFDLSNVRPSEHSMETDVYLKSTWYALLIEKTN